MNIELNKYALYGVISICVLILLIAIIICVVRIYRTKRQFDSIDKYNEKNTQNNITPYNGIIKQYNQNVDDCGIPNQKTKKKRIKEIFQIYKTLK